MTIEELDSLHPTDFLRHMRNMREGAVKIGLVPDVELTDAQMLIEALVSAKASRDIGRPWSDFQEALQNKCLEALTYLGGNS